MKKQHFLYLSISIVIFLSGMGIQYWYMNSHSSIAITNDKKISYWVAPMDPNYRRDKPGKSPMGMDLIPVYEEIDTNQDIPSIKIAPTIENNLGIRTAKVKKQDISRLINTVGSIKVDENQIEHVHVYTKGWIKELLIKAEGEYVKQGQLLFRMYSPALVNGQEEYLLSLKNSNVSLQDAALKKLKALGFSNKQMNSLKNNKKAYDLVDVYAKKAGIISNLNVGEGMFVKPDKIVMIIKDLSKIWLIAEVYERQSSWVKIGQKAEMSLPYIPGKIWLGKVNYVYPELDPKSLTLRVRILFENKLGDLKLNMFGDVKIYTKPKKDAIVIPQEAVIYTGEESRVVVRLEPQKYTTRIIDVGIESGNVVEVLDGLKEGEIIVTSAQFLIDSESNLKASFNRVHSQKSEKLKTKNNHQLEHKH